MTQAVTLAQIGSNNGTFRNKIINGAMVIDQRNAGGSVTPSGDQYTVDRWQIAIGSSGAWVSVQQNSGNAPVNQGFAQCLKLTSTGANTPSSGSIHVLQQRIEGNNIADLCFGTANAKTITLSFWVNQSVTGTYGGVVTNNGITRAYGFTYTINSANTWEYKTATIPGDTTGTWVIDNGIGMRVIFNTGSGSGQCITAGSWQTGTGGIYGVSGVQTLSSTSGATMYLTGVQLEAGTVPTSFELRSYSKELLMCQRYYELTGFGNIAIFESGSTYVMNLVYKVTKRAQPSIGLYWTSNIRVRQFGTSDRDASSPGVGSTAGSSNGGYIKINGFGSVGATSSVAGIGFTTSSENGDLFSISAEL